MTADIHRKIAGGLYIGHGVLCIAIIVYVVSMLWRLFSMALEGGSRDENLGVFIGAAAIVVSAILYVLQIIAGIIVLRREVGVGKWGIAGALFGIPSGLLGLVVAAYGLLVFLAGRKVTETSG